MRLSTLEPSLAAASFSAAPSATSVRAGLGLVDLETVAAVLVPAIELVSMAILVLGAVWATAWFVRDLLARRAGRGPDKPYHRYRSNLGRSILLGLEFLIVADIINTVGIEPTFRSLGILAIVVLIRTFVSFSLEVEINGRWPWQQARTEE